MQVFIFRLFCCLLTPHFNLHFYALCLQQLLPLLIAFCSTLYNKKSLSHREWLSFTEMPIYWSGLILQCILLGIYNKLLCGKYSDLWFILSRTFPRQRRSGFMRFGHQIQQRDCYGFTPYSFYGLRRRISFYIKISSASCTPSPHEQQVNSNTKQPHMMITALGFI